MDQLDKLGRIQKRDQTQRRSAEGSPDVQKGGPDVTKRSRRVESLTSKINENLTSPTDTLQGKKVSFYISNCVSVINNEFRNIEVSSH